MTSCQFQTSALQCFKLNMVVLLFCTSSSRSLQQWPGSGICITNKLRYVARLKWLLFLDSKGQSKIFPNLLERVWSNSTTYERTSYFLIRDQPYGWHLCRVGIAYACFPSFIMCPKSKIITQLCTLVWSGNGGCLEREKKSASTFRVSDYMQYE